MANDVNIVDGRVLAIPDDLDSAIEGVLRDLNAIAVMLDRFSIGAIPYSNVMNLWSRELEMTADQLETAWKHDRFVPQA